MAQDRTRWTVEVQGQLPHVWELLANVKRLFYEESRREFAIDDDDDDNDPGWNKFSGNQLCMAIQLNWI